MAMNPIRIVGSQIMVDGAPVVFRGRLSGKFIPWLAKGKYDRAYEWIDLNQKLKIDILKVHGEGERPKGVYANPPHYKPWPIEQMTKVHPDGKVGNRVRMDQVKRGPLEDMYRLSSETGMAFEYVIDCTLKDIEGMPSGMIGHAISRTLDTCRDIAESWPQAKVIFNFHDAYNIGVVKIDEGKGALGLQAGRTRRWVRMVGDEKQTQFSFRRPGPAWKPEQYPDAAIMVSEAGGTISYPCGDGVREYPIAATQTEGLQVDLGRLRRFRKPVWIDATEWATDDNADRYIAFMELCERKDVHLIITDEKGALTDARLPLTELERRLGGVIPPPPPPPPGEWETVTDWKETGSEYQVRKREVPTP